MSQRKYYCFFLNFLHHPVWARIMRPKNINGRAAIHILWCGCEFQFFFRNSYTWFPALRCRSRICSRIRFSSRFRNRFRRKTVSVPRSVCCCWGVCAAVARQALEAGRRVFRAKEWAELQASWLHTERQVRKNRTLSYMNGSTANANLRKRRTLFFT